MLRQLSPSLGYRIESNHHDSEQRHRPLENHFLRESSPVIEDRLEESRSAVWAYNLSLGSNRVVAPMVSESTRTSAPIQRCCHKPKRTSSEGA